MEVERNIKTVAEDRHNRKKGVIVVELDQFRYMISGFEKPMEQIKKSFGYIFFSTRFTGPFTDGPSSLLVPVKRVEKKIYPNDPCPCGSGKKYKNCCGRQA